MKDEVDVLGSPSLIVLMVSVGGKARFEVVEAEEEEEEDAVLSVVHTHEPLQRNMWTASAGGVVGVLCLCLCIMYTLTSYKYSRRRGWGGGGGGRKSVNFTGRLPTQVSDWQNTS